MDFFCQTPLRQRKIAAPYGLPRNCVLKWLLTLKKEKIRNMLKRILNLCKKDVVLTVAAILAVASCFVVPPDAKYAGYIDFDTLILLFSLMLIVGGLRSQGVFQSIARALLRRVHTARGVVVTLVALCFFSSMLITNDVSLITFIPFGIFLLDAVGLGGSLCLTVTLMTIAGNLGSMLTPIGNPQNLYLYGLSGLSLPRFLLLMLPYAAAAAVLLLASSAFSFRRTAVAVPEQAAEGKGDKRCIAAYLLLFAVCLVSVAKILPRPALLAIVVIAILLLDRRLFRGADYGLLVTFVCFFIFVGNVKRIESLQALLGGALQGRECLISVLVSQVISNVPAAVLLSGYTTDIPALLVGTNLGGLGTLIASMASLISWKQVAARDPALKKKYLLTFTVWNLVFLVVLYLMSLILR